MQKVITASQWKDYRSNQEALIAASTGARLQGSTGSNFSRPSFNELEFSSGAVANYFEYHNDENFHNETPFRVWAEKGAVRANHRWNPGSRWQRDLVEVRGYIGPKKSAGLRIIFRMS